MKLGFEKLTKNEVKVGDVYIDDGSYYLIIHDVINERYRAVNLLTFKTVYTEKVIRNLRCVQYGTYIDRLEL